MGENVCAPTGRRGELLEREFESAGISLILSLAKIVLRFQIESIRTKTNISTPSLSMSMAAEDEEGRHRQVALGRRWDPSSLSRTEPPGCTMALTPPRCLFHSIRKGEESIGSKYRAFQSVLQLARLCGSQLDGIHAAHLAGAHPHQNSRSRENNGVRFDMLHDSPGKDQGLLLLRGRLALRHAFP